METVTKHIFKNTVTGEEIAVYTRANESSIIAFVHHMQIFNRKLETAWSLQVARKRTFQRAVTAE